MFVMDGSLSLSQQPGFPGENFAPLDAGNMHGFANGVSLDVLEAYPQTSHTHLPSCACLGVQFVRFIRMIWIH